MEDSVCSAFRGILTDHGRVSSASLCPDRTDQSRDLAKEVGESEEYTAFYKLYSKLIHPSSWAVNSPSAIETPMYRQTLVINAQIDGWRLLQAVGDQFGVAVDRSYDAALAQVGKPTVKKNSLMLPNHAMEPTALSAKWAPRLIASVTRE